MMTTDPNRTQNGRDRRIHKNHGLIAGVLAGLMLIAAGILVVMHNLGAVSSHLFGILISWQMLLIALGVLCAADRRYGSAVLLAGAGLFWLIPRLTDSGAQWMALWWPVLLVFAGVYMIVKLFVPARERRNPSGPATHRTENGFVHLNSMLGGAEHIVLEEVFRGGSITATLGGAVLDLRHTSLPEGDTFIDIQATLSGVELYAPAGWDIRSEIKGTLGGVDDKRRGPAAGDPGSGRLILRGNVTLSGVEIKS